jgi:3-phenylpropionate/trans-cinnamate dioxygenase ferredoxin reductase subunit
MSDTYVIVGASLTGATAAATLRELGFAGEVILIGDEPQLPYERPPLTKGFLRGESALAAAAVHDHDFYAKESIELRIGHTVTGLDLAACDVTLHDGERLHYDRLLLATGARPRRLDVPGAQLDGVLALRNADDALALRSRLQPGTRLAVIGGGWIGMEAAASAVQLGVDVTLIEAGEVPLARVLGAQMGEFFTQAHRDRGVTVLTNQTVTGFAQAPDGTAVMLADGESIACDTVLVGVGVEPCVELAVRAGLAVSNGIEVDVRLRTADPRVYAAGDVALAEHPRYGRLRVEHWENARRQGRHVAASMLDRAEPFAAIPYFFSDQYDIGMEYSGLGHPDDDLVIRGDVTGNAFVAFWVRQGRITAGMNVNTWDVAEDIQRLIAADVGVDRERLADPQAPLSALCPTPAGSMRRP